MLKATIVATEDDAVNVFNWLANFTPFEELAEMYAQSPLLPIQDILVVASTTGASRTPTTTTRAAPNWPWWTRRPTWS
jgi:phosphoenolpyruvate carboxykinase (ATP)